MKAFNFTRGRQMRSPNVTEIIKEEGGGICTGNFLPCVLVQPPLTNNGNQHVSTFPLPAPPPTLSCIGHLSLMHTVTMALHCYAGEMCLQKKNG